MVFFVIVHMVYAFSKMYFISELKPSSYLFLAPVLERHIISKNVRKCDKKNIMRLFTVNSPTSVNQNCFLVDYDTDKQTHLCNFCRTWKVKPRYTKVCHACIKASQTTSRSTVFEKPFQTSNKIPQRLLVVYDGNPPLTGEFHSQSASNTESVSM